MARNNSIEDVEKILGEPFYAAFPDEVRRVRNNLIIVSAIAIFAVLGGVSVKPDASFLGIEFSGLTPHLIYVGILVMNIYLLVHFCWYSHDNFIEWWLRLTGTRTAFLTGGQWGDESADYPADPRQSTLYNWWRYQAMHIGATIVHIAELNDKFEEWESQVKLTYEGKDPNIHSLIQTMSQAHTQAFNLITAVKRMEEIFSDLRLPVSLGRFDNVFKYLMKAQNLRWIVLELGMPIFLSLISCGLIIRQLIQ